MELVRSSISIVSGLPCETVRSAPAIVVSGPAQRLLTLRPARSPSRHATLYTESSDSFVASAAASIATGWSEPVPGRELHPLKSSAFHGALFRQLTIFCVEYFEIDGYFGSVGGLGFSGALTGASESPRAGGSPRGSLASASAYARRTSSIVNWFSSSDSRLRLFRSFPICAYADGKHCATAELMIRPTTTEFLSSDANRR
jgi:hypothetical protein